MESLLNLFTNVKLTSTVSRQEKSELYFCSFRFYILSR
jgi:hypothetical protein